MAASGVQASRAAGREYRRPPASGEMTGAAPAAPGTSREAHTRPMSVPRPRSGSASPKDATHASLLGCHTCPHLRPSSVAYSHTLAKCRTLYSLQDCCDCLKRVTASHLAVPADAARSASCVAAGGPLLLRTDSALPGVWAADQPPPAARPAGAGRGRGLHLPTRNQSTSAGGRRRLDGMAPRCCGGDAH